MCVRRCEALVHPLTVVERIYRTLPQVRLSKWSVPQLSDPQAKYAALDVLKSLDVYFHLLSLDDLSARLTAADAIVGTVVDVVPPHGSVAVLATRCATARIVTPARWTPPAGCTGSLNPTAARALVSITELHAPSLVVPGVKREDRSPLTLGDLGDAPFTVMLPLKMLAKSSTQRRLTPADGANGGADAATPTPPQPAAATEADGDLDDAAAAAEADDDLDDAACHRSAVIAEARAALDAPSEGDGDDGAVAGYEGNGSGNDIADDLESGGAHDGYADDYAAELTADEIEKARAAVTAAARSAHGANADVPLDAPPAHITDMFSSVLGDAFHYMDRPKVPMHHGDKKGYFVALQEAWFAWNTERMGQVRKTLRTAGLTDGEIDAKMYFHVAFFRRRVERIVLPPSKLYWRVRAVFELYGPMVDSVTKNPLFNAAAWKKANNVLKEILLGLASDPPGMSFYRQALTRTGEFAYDSHGNALFDCERGTNSPGSVHKQVTTTFGTYTTRTSYTPILLTSSIA